MMYNLFLKVPLMFISNHVKNHLGPRAGNLVVWLSLIIGQPLALMMYYHDFVVAHYGSELIATFGTLST
jgi:diacylglycerol O-acyltransferase-1